jgi:hypothetical protein
MHRDEAASQRVTRLDEVLARRRPPTASPSRRQMPEPNTSDRNSHSSRVHEISDRKIAARFSGRLPTTRCGEEDRRLLRFSNGFWFLRSRSITHADCDSGRKLACPDTGYGDRGSSQDNSKLLRFLNGFCLQSDYHILNS